MIDVIANVTAYGAIIALGVLGFRHGVFLALLSAMAVMSAFIAAVALAPISASSLESLGIGPASSLPLAYVAILAAVVIVARLAAGALLSDEDVRFRPDIDRFAGAAVGAFAGLILGGALLVGWSMCELPVGWRLNAPVMHLDSGARCLWMFVRWSQPDARSRDMMFQGDVTRDGGGQEKVRASEPFDDADRNWMRDATERFLDYDKNGDFTLDQEVTENPLGKQGMRDAGLVDRYWLSAWRTLRVLHRPHITSAEFNVTEQVARAGETIYKAEAVDADDGDELEYDLTASGDAMLLQIDAKTGDVRFTDVPVDPELKKVTFTVRVRDRSDLTDEHEVTITLRPPTASVP